MIMVVQHNLQAMNSNRMLGITQGVMAKSTEKLSSGYKVNRAADDAAGLSISEKMRKQIRGLTQASLNAEDGISSVQTAEGALTEVHDMLQRLNELAVKASNGTNSVSDRQTIQDEVDQLLTEVDRVSETTKFNETYLLKGNVNGTSSRQFVNAHDAGIDGKLVDKGGDTATFNLTKALEDGDKIKIGAEEYTIGYKATTDSVDGYATYSKKNADHIGNTKLSAGDTITFADKTKDEPRDYKTATMVDKVENDKDNFKNGTEFSIVDENGHEMKYKVAAAAAAADANGVSTETAEGMENLIKEAFKKGHKVTMTKFSSDGTNTAGVNWEVVEKLEKYEIQATEWNTINGGALEGKKLDEILTDAKKTTDKQKDNGPLGKTATDIRSAVLGGKETTFTTMEPVSAADIAKAIGMMKAGDKFTITDKIGAGQGTTQNVIIDDATDPKANKYTVTDALKLLNVKEGDIDEITFTLAEDPNTAGEVLNTDLKSFLSSLDIEVTAPKTATTAVSVVGSPTKGDSTENLISAKEAYAKIADELQKASSIGTEEDYEASVKNNEDGSFVISKGSTTVKDKLRFNLHVGADADLTNKIGVEIGTMDTKGLGIHGLDVMGMNEDGERYDDGGMSATYAVDAIADAVAKVSAQRSLLGAVQNRLEHTIKNLDNVVENTTAAESQIRDTDMATEMVKYSNNQILSQAGMSMLAQSNQANQGVLSLLG